ncbi:MAG: 30S ribosome-binding factor RbfA [Chloroflexota bacterium]
MTRRIDRLNYLIRAEISDLLLREVKDPRLGGFLTITRIDTSADLRHSKVFVSVMGTEDERREAFIGLEAASGFIRRQLRDRLTLRRVPELSFHKDDSIESGARILKLIKEVAVEDVEEGRQE